MLPNEISYARNILWSEPWAHNQSEWRHEKESKLRYRPFKHTFHTIVKECKKNEPNNCTLHNCESMFKSQDIFLVCFFFPYLNLNHESKVSVMKIFLFDLIPLGSIQLPLSRRGRHLSLLGVGHTPKLRLW
jgi:hypothetical protein